MARQKRIDVRGRRRRRDCESHTCGIRLRQEPRHAGAQWTASVRDQLRVERRLLAMDQWRELAQPRALSQRHCERTDVVVDALLAAGDLEQLAIDGPGPFPFQMEAQERIVERLAVRLLGVGERSIDVEDQGIEIHRASPCANTRLTSRSAAMMVVSDSSLVATSGCEYNR